MTYKNVRSLRRCMPSLPVVDDAMLALDMQTALLWTIYEELHLVMVRLSKQR